MKKKLLWCITIALLLLPVFSVSPVHAADDFTPPSFGEDFEPPSTGGEFTPPSLDPNSPNYGGNLNGDVKKNLQSWQEELSISDPLTSIVRGLAWWLIIETGEIVNAITGAFDYTYQIFDLYGSDEKPGPLQKTIDNYLPLFVAIGIVFFISMTLGILFSKNQDLVIILKNIFLGVSIFILLPFGFGQISTLTTNMSKLVSSSNNTGYAVVDQNISDLYAIDKNYAWVVPKQESLKDKEEKRNYLEDISKKKLQNVNINEPADPSKMSKTGKKITTNMLVTNEKGQLTTVSLNDGVGKSWWMSLLTGDPEYYRYHVNFFTLIFYNLLVLIITAFLLYKLIKIELELVMSAAVLQATSTIDTKGKRNWEIISKIISSFGAIVMVVFLQVFFSDAYAVTSTLKGGPVVQAVAGIALAFSVIEGPNVFQSTFGVHAGLDSGLKDLMTLSQTSMLLNNGGGAAAKLSQGALNMGAGAMGTTAGLIAGSLGDSDKSGDDSLSQKLGESSGEDQSDNDLNADNSHQEDMDLNNQNSENLENENDIDEKNIAEDAGGSDMEDMDVSGLNDTNSDLMSLSENEPLSGELSAGEESMGALSPEMQDADMSAPTESLEQPLSSEEGPRGEREQNSAFEDRKAPDLGDIGRENPHLGQISAGESEARPSGLGSTIRSLTQQAVSNKVQSPTNNTLKSFASSYNTSQALTKGTKNSFKKLSTSKLEK